MCVEASAQNEAEYLIDVRAKMGAITARIPKATPNNNPYYEIDNAVELVKPKSEVLHQIGITQKQAERYEALAKEENRPIIEAAKVKARENNELVTQTEILRQIKEQSHPHVSNNSRNDNEWYTPVEYLESVKDGFEAALIRFLVEDHL